MRNNTNNLNRPKPQIRSLEDTPDEREDLFQATFDEAPIGVGHLDSQGRWLRVNPHFCRMVGYSPMEMVLRTLFSITHPDDTPPDLNTSSGLQTWSDSREIRIVHKFGTQMWVHLTVILVRRPLSPDQLTTDLSGYDDDPSTPEYLTYQDPSTAVTTQRDYFVAYLQDIDTRHAAEERLRHQLVINRSITNSTAEGLFMLDPHGRVTFINPAGEELIGWRSSEILGKLLEAKVLPESEGPGSALFTSISAFPTAGVGQYQESVFTRKNGSRIPVLFSMAPIIDPGGMLMGSVLAAHNTSELKRAQRDLRLTAERNKRIADTLQRSLMMEASRRTFRNLDVQSVYRPASDEAEVGGDFCDAISLERNRVALVVGDVVGKGLQAAARTAEIKFTLRAFLRGNSLPDMAMQSLNEILCESLTEENEEAIVCLSLAVVNLVSGEVRMAVGGCEPPVLLHRDGTTDTLDVGGLPLGAFAEATFAPTTFRLSPGDTLLMMTDGVTEARSEGAIYGLDPVIRTASAHAAEPLETLLGAILEGARGFAGGTLQDDACILGAHRHE